MFSTYNPGFISWKASSITILYKCLFPSTEVEAIYNLIQFIYFRQHGPNKEQEAQLRDRATRKPASFWDTGRGNGNLYDWNNLHLSFKVIRSGTNRKLVYYFLLYYSNFMPYNAPFTSYLMWNSLMTLKYRQDHQQSYHLKAVVWFLFSNFSFCGRIVYNFDQSIDRSSNVEPIESSYMSCY